MCNQITNKNTDNSANLNEKIQNKRSNYQGQNLSVTSKEDCQNNNLSKQCSKFPSKTLIQSQRLYYQLSTMFRHVICLKFKNIQYIQR